MPHAFSRKKLLFWKITLSESTLLCFPLFSLPFFPLYFLCCSKKNKQKIWQMRSFSNIGSFFHGVNWILFNNSNLQISFQYHHSKKEVSIFILILSSKKEVLCLACQSGIYLVQYCARNLLNYLYLPLNTHYELFNHRLHFIALNWHEKNRFTSLNNEVWIDIETSSFFNWLFPCLCCFFWVATKSLI